MAVGSASQKTQFGREAAKGTAIPATELLRGPASQMTDLTQISRVAEQTGRYSTYGRTEKVSVGATVVMPSQAASYEQLPHVFEAGIETVTAGGTGPTYTYSYAVATSTSPTIKTYTIEVGDENEAEEAEYCFVESFELTGAPNEMVMFSANWRGRQVTATTFTAAISPIDVNTIVFNHGKLFIDDSGGTIGTGQVSNSFLAFRVSVDTGMRAIWTGEGNLYFTFEKLTRPVITGQITAEHDASWDSTGEKAEWRAQNTRLLRIEFTNGNFIFRVDAAMKWDTFGALEDQDGNSILRGSWTAHESDTDSLFVEFFIQNERSAL